MWYCILDKMVTPGKRGIVAMLRSMPQSVGNTTISIMKNVPAWENQVRISLVIRSKAETYLEKHKLLL